jgi:hypothetical protein
LRCLLRTSEELAVDEYCTQPAECVCVCAETLASVVNLKVPGPWVCDPFALLVLLRHEESVTWAVKWLLDDHHSLKNNM